MNFDPFKYDIKNIPTMKPYHTKAIPTSAVRRIGWFGSIVRLGALLLIVSSCSVVFGQGVADAEVEAVNLDPRVASMVCAAAAIIAEDEVLAGWFATIVAEPESIEYFLDLFNTGLTDGSVSTEDIADVVEACIAIRDDIEALDASESE